MIQSKSYSIDGPWLRLRASTAKVTGSILVQWTKIHPTSCTVSQKFNLMKKIWLKILCNIRRCQVHPSVIHLTGVYSECSMGLDSSRHGWYVVNNTQGWWGETQGQQTTKKGETNFWSWHVLCRAQTIWHDKDRGQLHLTGSGKVLRRWPFSWIVKEEEDKLTPSSKTAVRRRGIRNQRWTFGEWPAGVRRGEWCWAGHAGSFSCGRCFDFIPGGTGRDQKAWSRSNDVKWSIF